MGTERHDCSQRVFSAERGDWNGHPCRTSATIEEDGKWWCKRHAPSLKAERDVKAREKRAAEQAAFAAPLNRAKGYQSRLAQFGLDAYPHYHINSYTGGVYLGPSQVEKLLKMLEGN